MSTQTHTLVAIDDASVSGALSIVYLDEDNKPPSVQGAEAEANVNSCTVASTTIEETEEQRRLANQLKCAKDALAWPIRYLRLYLDELPGELFSSTGTTSTEGMYTETVIDYLEFEGVREVSLSKLRATEVEIGTSAIVDYTGNTITPDFTFNGVDKIQTTDKVYGVVEVTYKVTYRSVKLVVVPTGLSFQAMVVVRHEGKVGYAVVPLEVQPCPYDTDGVAAGSECSAGLTDLGFLTWTTQAIYDNWPESLGRYVQILEIHHEPEVIVGQTFEVHVKYRTKGKGFTGNIFFKIGDIDRIECALTVNEANVTKVMTLVGLATEAGRYTTTAGIVGSIYNHVTNRLEVIPEDDLLGIEYTEIGRETEEIVIGSEPNTVTIDRIKVVTFESDLTGKKLTLKFNNPV